MQQSTPCDALSALLEALGLTPIEEVEESEPVDSQDCNKCSTHLPGSTVCLERPITPFAMVGIPFSDDTHFPEKHGYGFRVGVRSNGENPGDETGVYLSKTSRLQRPGSSSPGSSEVINPSTGPSVSPVGSHSRLSGQEKEEDPIIVKAALNATIIVLRAPRRITFREIKYLLHKKFVRQEDVFLSQAFSVVFVSPSGESSSMPTSRRKKRVSFTHRTEMRFVEDEADWRMIASMHGGTNKITLRIIDTPP